MVVVAHDGISGLRSHVDQTAGSVDCFHGGCSCRMGPVGAHHRRHHQLCKLRSFLACAKHFSLCYKSTFLLTTFLLLDSMGKALPGAFYNPGSPPSHRLHIDLLPSFSTPVQPTLLCHIYPRRLRPHPPYSILPSLPPIALHRGSTGTCLERHCLWIRHPAPI